MTNIELRIAAEHFGESRFMVCAGKRGTEDYDTGYVVSFRPKFATVAWASGSRTDCPKRALRWVKP